MGKLKNIAVVLFMIVFLASLFMNVVHFASRQQKTRDTTRTTYVDTIPFYKPIPKDSFVIRYVTERLPTVSKLPENVQKLPESVSEFPKSVKNFHESVSFFTFMVSSAMTKVPTPKRNTSDKNIFFIMVKFKCLPTDRYHKRQEKYTSYSVISSH